MLAFVELVHALPTTKRKVPNSSGEGGVFASRGRNMGRNAFVQGELAFMLWELFVA
jgi:hypothetical protein